MILLAQSLDRFPHVAAHAQFGEGEDGVEELGEDPCVHAGILDLIFGQRPHCGTREGGEREERGRREGEEERGKRKRRGREGESKEREKRKRRGKDEEKKK